MKQMSTSLLCCKLLSARDLNTPIAYLVPISIRKPNCSSVIQFTAVTLPSILLVRILSIIFDTCNVRLIVRKSRQSVAFAFFSSEIITICKKSLGHSPVMYICWHISTNSVVALTEILTFHPEYRHPLHTFRSLALLTLSKLLPSANSAQGHPLLILSH